jgi:hypothetical protein
MPVCQQISQSHPERQFQLRVLSRDSRAQWCEVRAHIAPAIQLELAAPLRVICVEDNTAQMSVKPGRQNRTVRVPETAAPSGTCNTLCYSRRTAK